MLRSAIVSVAVGAGALTIIAPAVSAQAATPTVSFQFVRNHVTHDITIKLSVHSANLRSGTTLYLQRTVGTRHIFKNVKKLKVHNGTAVAPGVAMGRYRYRIIAARNGTRVATSLQRYLWSYGPVTAAQLCTRSQYAYFNNSCYGGTIQVGSSVFEYATDGGSGNTGPDQEANVTATKSSCRRATLRFAVSNDSASNGVTSFGTSLTQTSADEQQASAAAGTVGVTTFKIKSLSWDLEFWTNTGDDPVFWNGWFSCWSSSGDN